MGILGSSSHALDDEGGLDTTGPRTELGHSHRSLNILQKLDIWSKNWLCFLSLFLINADDAIPSPFPLLNRKLSRTTFARGLNYRRSCKLKHAERDQPLVFSRFQQWHSECARSCAHSEQLDRQLATVSLASNPKKPIPHIVSRRKTRLMALPNISKSV